MAKYAPALDVAKANIVCEINVMTLDNVTKVTFLPVLSIMKPRIGEATAENKYGKPGQHRSE